jgi:hypothetical protein
MYENISDQLSGKHSNSKLKLQPFLLRGAMTRRDAFNPLVSGLWVRFNALLMILFLVAACSPGTKSNEDLTREISDLKKEVKAMHEKLDKLQAGQQTLLEHLKKFSPPVAAAPVQPLLAVPPPPASAQPKPLTVSQLLAGKDQYLGTRVTVKGPVGPIMVNHKSLFLKSPEGMVEVFFGKLPDQKLVQFLTAAPPEKSVTVTGTVSLPPRVGAAKLQINAEAVEL